MTEKRSESFELNPRIARLQRELFLRQEALVKSRSLFSEVTSAYVLAKKDLQGAEDAVARAKRDLQNAVHEEARK